MNLCDCFEVPMQYVNNSPHQQGYGLRPWYEEENEADIALVYAFSFMIKDTALITFGCETGQIEGSRGDASLDNGDLQ